MSRNKSSNKALTACNSSADLAFGELGELLGYRLRRAQIAMHRDFTAAIADLDLTQKQTAILWLVSNNPGVSQAALASALGMDRPSMMSLTDRLQDRGLVTRTRSEVDRRFQELHLTRAGSSMLNKVKQRIAQHEQRMRGLFTENEFRVLVGALQKFQQPDAMRAAADPRPTSTKKTAS